MNFEEGPEHDEREDHARRRAERDAVDPVREEEKLLDQAIVFDAVVGESAGHVFAEHGVGEEAAGHDDEWPAEVRRVASSTSRTSPVP